MANVIYEKCGSHIVIITMDRPEKLNAYDIPMLKEMEQCWYKFRDDEDAWVAILTGAGKAFCTGHDLDTLDRLGWEFEPPSIHYGNIEIYKPIIAAVHGYALGGGCSMALGCDLIVAAKDAVFGYPQPAYSLTSLGGHQRLPRLTFPKIAMEMMLTGDKYTAQEFFKLGLINKVVPPDRLMQEAVKMAERITKNGPLAVFATKEDFIRGQRMTCLQDGIRFAQLNYGRIWHSQDRVEGMQAFKEKRKPNWQGE